MSKAEEGNDTSASQRRPIFLGRTMTASSVLKRAVVIVILGYFIWILKFAWSWGISGDISSGVWWTSGGPGTLFPIPSPPGILAVMTHAYPTDTFIFLVFMNDGLWILWTSLALLYVISPYRINTHRFYSLLHEKLG
jgi:hypothetical protein